MDNENQYQTKIVNSLLDKFVSEEIMTKSDFKVQIDEIMTKHERKLDQRFELIDQKFDKIDQKFDKMEHIISNTVKWNAGIALGTILAVCGLIVTLIPLLHK
jgi:hypothetical protein